MPPPLRNRRNAFSIRASNVQLAGQVGQIKSTSAEQPRTMSVSDEMQDPRLRKILSQGEASKTSTCILTDAQINAFKEVFDLFDSNGGGTIDADELDLALQSVGICLGKDDLAGVLETMDKDGNGEIDFNEFLNLMTNTEKFLESFDSRVEGEKRRREIMLFDALTQFMKNSALHSMEEIVGYFSSKYKRSQAPHVVGHYAAGARLIGLTEKQMQLHMERMRATNADSSSPYAQPLYNLNSSLKRAKLAPKPTTSLATKRGKIRLKFHFESSARRTGQYGEGKKDNRVTT